MSYENRQTGWFGQNAPENPMLPLLPLRWWHQMEEAVEHLKKIVTDAGFIDIDG